jgi:hypothetical protein
VTEIFVPHASCPNIVFDILVPPPLVLDSLTGIETLAEAWERYHGFMTDLPTTDMEDWEFNQGFYYGCHKKLRST